MKLTITDRFSTFHIYLRRDTGTWIILLFQRLPNPPRALLDPRDNVSLRLIWDIMYNIRVGSGGGTNCVGNTPNLTLQSSDHNSLLFANVRHDRETQAHLDNVLASQNCRIWGTTSEINLGSWLQLLLVLDGNVNINRRFWYLCNNGVDIGRGMKGTYVYTHP